MLLPGIAGRNSCPIRKLPRVWPIDVKGYWYRLGQEAWALRIALRLKKGEEDRTA